MKRPFAALATFSLSLLAAMSAQAAPIISPFAADLSAGSYSASAAYPGTSAQSVFNGGYWNIGSHGLGWIQADMGSTQTLSEVRLTVDVTPWTTTWQDVYLSDTPIGNLYTLLTPVVSRNGYTTQYQQFDLHFTPTSGRYLQVVSYGGASWTALGDGYGRSNWTDTGAIHHAVPEPASLALAAIGVLALTASRQRQR